MINIARMFMDEQRALLSQTHNRLAGVIRQLSDDDVNWHPNDQSNSITNLVLHICGNIGQRFFHQIDGQADVRNRTAEFDPTARRTQAELLALLDDHFGKIDPILARMPLACLYDDKGPPGQPATVFKIILTSSAHYTEHLGQVISTAKLRLGPRYQYLAHAPTTRP
jgi:hypothetical protein